MKLNAATEMAPVTWPEFNTSTRSSPPTSRRAAAASSRSLSGWLCEITGYAAVSLQPNAGSQGELSGLLAIAAYHESRGEGHRRVCLIPASAHGTNAASAVMAGCGSSSSRPRLAGISIWPTSPPGSPSTRTTLRRSW